MVDLTELISRKIEKQCENQMRDLVYQWWFEKDTEHLSSKRS